MKIKVFLEETQEWVEKEISEPEFIAFLDKSVREAKEEKKEESATKELEKEKFLTPEEVATRLSLSVRQVLDFARDETIPSIKYNARVIRFAESELLEFLRIGRGK